MEYLLYLAAFLAFAIGMVHSVLGERAILIRLFRRDDLPKLFGGTAFTVSTLRFAWHLTTIAWWGLGVTMIYLARPTLERPVLGAIIASTFFVHFLIALFASKGKHLAWVVFLAIAGLVFYATRF